MPEWLSGVLDWIELHPGVAGLVICLVAFLEGLALIGIIIPGIIILFGFGALVGLDVLNLASVWFWCSLGAILGDGVSFFLGYHFQNHIREIWPFNRFGQLFYRGEVFFRRHGLKSIVIGRFVGPIRPIMPVVAGMMNMNLKRYIPANIVAGILWAPAYLLPGVVFGASLELAMAVAFRLAMLLVVIAAVTWLLLWLVSSSYRYLAPRTSRMLTYALAWSHRHPVLGRLTTTLVDPSRPESGTLAALALLLIVSAWGVLSLLIAWSLSSGPLPMDVSVLAVMRQLQTPWADRLMILVHGLGSPFVLLPAASAVFVWLLWRRRFLAAWHWGGAVAVGFILAVAISFALSFSADPAPARFDPGPLSTLPSLMGVVIYGFFAILIARELPYRSRVWPYAVAAILVSGIVLAQLYFGLRWTSDLLVGIGFGLAWVVIIGIAYRRRIRRSFWTVPVAGMFYLLIVGAGSMYGWHYGRPILERIESTHPTQVVTADHWWQSGWRLRDDNGLWDRAWQKTQPNFEYAGALQPLHAALEASGWTAAPPAGPSALLQVLQPNPSPQSLPILASDFRGREEVALYHRWTPDQTREQLALRLWPTGVSLDDGRPLWVGVIARHQIQTVLYFFSYWDYGPPYRVEARTALMDVLRQQGFLHKSLNGLLLIQRRAD